MKARAVSHTLFCFLVGSTLWGCAQSPVTHEAGEWPAATQQLAQTLLRTPQNHAWEPYRWPGKRAAPFQPVHQGGRAALRVDADSTVSVLRQRFEPAVHPLGRLRFQWKVDALPRNANLREAHLEDSAVRVVLAFDGDRSRLSARAHQLSELSQLLTGEPLPYATLVYVWSEHDPVGTVIHNPRTDRIRKLVVSSGREALGRWQEHERDVRSDFRLAFGEEPGPALNIALMSDTDNTRSRARAWFGELSLEPPTP